MENRKEDPFRLELGPALAPTALLHSIACIYIYIACGWWFSQVVTGIAD